jgi:hypothetical protein
MVWIRLGGRVVVSLVRRARGGGSGALDTMRWWIHLGQTPPHRDPVTLRRTIFLSVYCRIR